MRNIKTDNDDRIISIAILSTPVILTIQYFILIVFNLVDTQFQSIVQLASMSIVGLLFIRAFPRVYTRGITILMISYYLFALLFITQFYFYVENREHIINLIIPFFAMSLLVFNYSLKLKNWKIFKDIMMKASNIIFVFGFILSFLIFSGAVNINVYSMSLSYYMLVPSLIYLNESIERISVKYLLLTLISFTIILSIGSRGALLCLGIFFIMKIMTLFKNITYRRTFFLLIIAIPLLLLIFNINYTLFYIFNQLANYGIYSRTLDLLITNLTYSSGRETLYQRVIEAMNDNYLIGLGVAGDRVIFNGDYVHNIILEVFLNFGMVIGVILIISYFSVFLYSIFVSNKLQTEILLIWSSIGLIPLFVSSSYWIDMEFWTFNGLLLAIIIKKFRVIREVGS